MEDDSDQETKVSFTLSSSDADGDGAQDAVGGGFTYVPDWNGGDDIIGAVWFWVWNNNGQISKQSGVFAQKDVHTGTDLYGSISQRVRQGEAQETFYFGALDHWDEDKSWQGQANEEARAQGSYGEDHYLLHARFESR